MDFSSAPPSILQLAEWLNQQRFVLVQEEEDAQAFGNQYGVWNRDRCRVRIILDRGEWWMEFAASPLVGYVHLDQWEAFIDDFPLAGELSHLEHQVRFLRTWFDEILERAKEPAVEDTRRAIRG